MVYMLLTDLTLYKFHCPGPILRETVIAVHHTPFPHQMQMRPACKSPLNASTGDPITAASPCTHTQGPLRGPGLASLLSGTPQNKGRSHHPEHQATRDTCTIPAEASY